MRFHTRLGLATCVSFLSIVTLILLIPDARVDQLQKIALGAGIDKYTLWRWRSASEDGTVSSLRLVVFGDSWVDDRDNVQNTEIGKGGSWADVLCEEVWSIQNNEAHVLTKSDQLYFHPQPSSFSTFTIISRCPTHWSYYFKQNICFSHNLLFPTPNVQYSS